MPRQWLMVVGLAGLVVSVLCQDSRAGDGGTVTVAAGTLSCDYDTSDSLYAYPIFGPHGYMLLCGTDLQANPILDLGSERWVTALFFTNRSLDTYLAVGTTQVYMAGDASAFNDGIQVSDFDLAVSSAVSPSPSTYIASTVRTLELTRPVYCRYLKLVTTGNLIGPFSAVDGLHDLTQIGELAVPPESVDASDYSYDAADATNALQAAINTRAKTVHVPNMGTDWVIRPVFLVSNQEIIFADGVNVVAKRNEFHGGGDCLFTAAGVRNLKLTGTNTTFKMWKSDYADPNLYTTAEWRHGISLLGCDTVALSGITVKETGGDGIYIGSSGSVPCSNITIQNMVCDRNYRQGMSVISVDTLAVDNCIFRATSGTAPMDGIDFEPDASTDELTNISVTHCIFEANESAGIEFCTGNLSPPDNFDALIENCTFYGNQSAGLTMTDRSSSLVVKDCLFLNSPCGIANTDWSWFVPTYTGFKGNIVNSFGLVWLGTGCVTGVQPVFISTIYGNAGYMYLAPSCPAAIKTGASDGGYMGARP